MDVEKLRREILSQLLSKVQSRTASLVEQLLDCGAPLIDSDITESCERCVAKACTCFPMIPLRLSTVLCLALHTAMHVLCRHITGTDGSL